MIRANIRVGGIVQGVGFRPFIHRQTERFGLTGWIRNTSEGAEIEVEGSEEGVEAFLRGLREDRPKLALIRWVKAEKYTELRGYRDFQILESRVLRERNTLISPDVCVCPDCLRELRDPADRRYRYPFINCTNCGPRFTIIRDVPYDRANTTMQAFPLCEACGAEYRSILDRRYHAEPVACPDCGPSLFYLDEAGNPTEGDPLAAAVSLLQRGGILAVKGLGGIHLACRLEDADTVRLLRSRKRRDEKAFAVMCRDRETAERFVTVSPEEAALLESFRRPIVLLKKQPAYLRRSTGDPMQEALEAVSGNSRVGVMLPYTPVHYLLMEEEASLVMTSANLSDLPILYRNGEAVAGLRGIADGFLLNNREIHVRCDDSVVWAVDGEAYFARRSRGYVPDPLTLHRPAGRILACGAEQKGSFCLSKEELAFSSAHIGDLKNVETLDHYEEQIGHFEKIFDITPEALVCDLHPDYLSTGYAEARARREGLPLYRVQHHWAHMASCMADNRLAGPVIGIIWDGTGYGTDGTAWGGEWLVGDFSSFDRAGSLRPMTLPGGDRAVKEIWRMGCSLLAEAGISRAEAEAIGMDPERYRLAEKMLQLGINTPVSTGMGRLFDGAAAILGIREQVSYEGQGAVLLEAAADRLTAEGAAGPAPQIERDAAGKYVFDWRPLIRTLYLMGRQGADTGAAAAYFMDVLAEAAVQLSIRIRQDTGISRVVCSGGSFQNMYLLKEIMARLREAGFQAFHHRQVSTNDEGICLGQLMIGAELHKKAEKENVPCSTT